MARPFTLFAVVFAAVGTAACASMPLPAQAIELNRAGAAALASGDLETAEARIALALEYSARFTEAWVNLGLIEMRRGNFERALHDFVKARDLNPDLPAPHHALGVLADRQGDGDRAETHYRAALRVDPGFAPARIDLGRRLFERGALEEAREQFLRVTEVAPEFPEGWSGLCEVLLRLDRIDDAALALARAVGRFGHRPHLSLLEARVLLRRGDFAGAEAHLTHSTLLVAGSDPTFEAEALAWLAIARLAQGRSPSGCEAAARAAAVDAHDGVARYATRACDEATHAVGASVTQLSGGDGR
jgi:Flp pilus assembly protein TadD